MFTGRRRELGLALEASLPGSKYVYCDHTVAEDCERAVAEALTHGKGRIDVLFNNAGIVDLASALDTTESDLERVLAVNVVAPHRMSRLVASAMIAAGIKGCIVNNASDWGLVGATGALAYAVSKAALVQMTKCMALDCAKDGIRVNAVCPGDTFVERWIERGDFARNDEEVGTEASADHLLKLRENQRHSFFLFFL